MVVVRTLEAIVELLEGGFQFEKLTIGNMGNQVKTESTVPLTKYVSINDETLPQVKAIAAKGVAVKAQLIPEDEEEDVMEILNKKNIG